jgi:hypothetical protein
MANEIRTVGNLQETILGVAVTSGSQQITQTTKGKCANVQLIPTTLNGTALFLGDVTVPRWAMFHNLDASNFVEIAAGEDAGFVAMLRIPPKLYVGPVCLATAAPKARANSAAVKLDYTILQE